MTVNVFEVGGTYNTFTISNPTTAEPFFFKNVLDPRLNWVGIPYPGELLDMKASVAVGDTNLTAAITANPGPFLLAGTSQGAIVTSDIYDQLRTGALQNRRADLLGAVTLGNPRRQAGHTFPGGPTAGITGHGIDAANLLVNTENLWWDFAVPGDNITCCPDTPIGQQLTGLFNQDWNSTSAATLILDGLASLPALASLIYTLEVRHGLYVGSTHFLGQTLSYYPLNDGRTCLQIAAAYLNTFASHSHH